MEKCWANKLNNCCETISREHLISDTILENIIRVKGLSWCKDKITTIGRKGLVSKILCKTHNSQLSTIDNEAGNFSNTLIQFDRDFNKIKKYGFNIKNPPLTYSINGELLEKWFCKTLINFCLVNEKELVIDLNELIPFVFGDKKFQQPYGLYFATKPDQIVGGRESIFEFTPLTNDVSVNLREVAGGLFILKGYYFVLLIPCSAEPNIKNGYSLNLPQTSYLDKWNTLQLYWHLKQLNQPIKRNNKNYLVQKINFNW